MTVRKVVVQSRGDEAMKAVLRLFLGAMLALVSISSFAHPDHGDETPVSKEQATLLAARAVALLVEQKHLAPTWQTKKLKDVATTETPMGPVWIVSFENPNETDKAKRLVYIYLDEFGNYLGGNHTGKR